MKNISILDRILLLFTVLLAAYQISFGLYSLNPLATWSYTVGFGVLVVASLLLIILGFEGLESQPVVIVSALIPLSISLGLVAEHLPQFTIPYLVFAILGFAAIAITRYTMEGKIATIVLAVIHGIAGSLITFLPIVLYLQGTVSADYILVSLGGAVIGVGGLLLAFLKAGKPILSQKTILTVLSILLLLMTSAFVYGFTFR
jgi:hypothetical protein